MRTVPPGTQLRRVVRHMQLRDGVYLHLECGHTMWLAGPPAWKPPATFPCLIGPCYRMERYFGD